MSAEVSLNTGTSESDTTATTNTSTGTANDNNGTATGNTNNTGGSQNQSGILFPIESEVSELESELIGMIKTTGKEKNYELIEYVNDVNREYTEVLQELNINGIMDTSYTYGNERLTNERFTGEVAHYTYDPRGSVSGLTDNEGMLYQSYRYDPFGGINFGKPQYNNVYAYNAESYNGNTEHQYLRARYYDTDTADFLTEDSYLGKLKDPLTLNRYNYVKSSPLNYIDPSGNSISETVANTFDSIWKSIRSKITELFSGSEDGSITIYQSGYGENRVEVKIQLAEQLAEYDDCEFVNAIASFVFGLMVEDAYYLRFSDIFVPMNSPIRQCLKLVAKTELIENFLVERYLNPEMYYLGKLFVDWFEKAKSNGVSSATAGADETLKQWMKNTAKYTHLMALGSLAVGGSAALVTGGTSGAAGATTAVLIEVAGLGTITVLAAADVTVGIVDLINGINNQDSYSNADKNANKISEGTGSAKPTKTLTEEPFSPQKMKSGCEDVAKAVQEEIGGQIYEITSKLQNTSSIGPVNYSGGTVTGWGHHVAVIKDGIVYDGLTGSNGMPEEIYQKMFEYWDVLNFKPVP